MICQKDSDRFKSEFWEKSLRHYPDFDKEPNEDVKELKMLMSIWPEQAIDIVRETGNTFMPEKTYQENGFKRYDAKKFLN